MVQVGDGPLAQVGGPWGWAQAPGGTDATPLGHGVGLGEGPGWGWVGGSLREAAPPGLGGRGRRAPLFGEVTQQLPSALGGRRQPRGHRGCPPPPPPGLLQGTNRGRPALPARRAPASRRLQQSCRAAPSITPEPISRASWPRYSRRPGPVRSPASFSEGALSAHPHPTPGAFLNLLPFSVSHCSCWSRDASRKCWLQTSFCLRTALGVGWGVPGRLPARPLARGAVRPEPALFGPSGPGAGAASESRAARTPSPPAGRR